MTLQGLVAPRRGRGAIRQAAKVAGNGTRAIEVVVARENRVHGRRRPVHTAVVAIVEVGRRSGARIVVQFRVGCRARLVVGLGEEIHQRADRGVDARRWNLIIEKRLATRADGVRLGTGGGVDHRRVAGNACRRGSRRAEVADALVIQRHGRDARETLLDARPLIVEEEEETVALDRTAQASAELVLVILGLGLGGALGEVVKGVKVLVAHVLVCRAMQLVGSAAGVHGDHRARSSAILGRVRIRDHIELRDHIHRRVSRLCAQLLHILGKGVVVDAVQKEVVLQRMNAVDVETSRAPGRGCTALIGVAGDLHARNGAQQIVPVAQKQRYAVDGVCGDQRADRRVVARQVHFLGAHPHRLIDCADGEMEIQADPLADPQRHLLLEGGEPWSGDAQRVIPDREIRKDVVAVRPALRRPRVSRCG